MLVKKDLSVYFNVSKIVIESFIKQANIRKITKLQQLNRVRNSKEKYGYEYPWQNQTVKDRLKKSLLEKYKVDNIAKLDFIKVREHETKKKNNSYGKSKIEDKIYNLLTEKFGDVYRQYISEKYPFACDFYIPKIDTYIEYQGYWSHGNEPFVYTEKQKEIINLWESKNTNHYKNAVYVWTIRDPLKRKTAKNNNLKWLEFFNMEQFMQWYNQ